MTAQSSASQSASQPASQRYHTITPYLVVHDTVAAIDFYQRAFGATEIYRLAAPDGKSIWHAEISLGDSHLFLGDELPQMGGQPAPITLGGSAVGMHLNVDDVDAWFERAIQAGATIAMPVQNMFWGDRYGKLIDPFGHHWSLSTPVEEVSPEEMQKRVAAFQS